MNYVQQNCFELCVTHTGAATSSPSPSLSMRGRFCACQPKGSKDAMALEKAKRHPNAWVARSKQQFASEGPQHQRRASCHGEMR